MDGSIPRSAGLAASVRIAERQNGVIARRQALGAGLSASAVRRLAQSGLWGRTYPGVFTLWKPQEPKAQWLQRLAGAVLWLGDGSGASHRASALVWGLDGIAASPIELSTRGRRRTDRPGIVIHRVRSLPDSDLVTKDGVRLTSPERTILDLGAVVSESVLEVALESALRLGLVTLAGMAERLERSALTTAGRGLLRAVLLGRPDTPTESVLESLVWRTLVEGGIPPVRQYEVMDHSGATIGRVDFAYQEARVAVEADGYRYHSHRKEWRRDRVRQNALVAEGWIIHRVTWEDVRRPKKLVEDVRKLLVMHLRERPQVQEKV